MIRYCVGALFLVACGTVGTVKDPPPVYDPVEKITPIPSKYAAPRSHTPQHRCDVPFENKRTELLYRIDCLADGTGGA